jgi:hypothetical protein
MGEHHSSIGKTLEVIIVLGLLTKYCEVCGVTVGKGQDYARFGKHFCSQEHAAKYATEMEQRRLNNPAKDSGGCC